MSKKPKELVRKRGSRERICNECGALETIRSDNPATKCRRCSARSSGAKGLLARYFNHLLRSNACQHCGDTYHSANRKFCSMSCCRAGQSIERQCKRCSTNFRAPKSRIGGRTNSTANFCSRECYNLFLCKDGGIGSRGPGWAAAKKEALRRNPFCAACGTLRRLHVHHIVPYRLTRDNGQENLIPLCSKHHKQIENLYLKNEPTLKHRNDLLWWRRFDLVGMQNLTRYRLSLIIEDVYGKAA